MPQSFIITGNVEFSGDELLKGLVEECDRDLPSEVIDAIEKCDRPSSTRSN